MSYETEIVSNNTIRVLHVVTQMNRNGLESRIMDIYRNIDRTRIQFDFLTHRKEPGHFDEEIISLGGKVYNLDKINPLKFTQYIKWLNDFFAEHAYKIVHVHLNHYSTWALEAAKKAGVPVRIAHSRNSGVDPNWKAIFKIGSKLFINFPTTHKFACSLQAGIYLFGKRSIQPPNFFKVIPNGFNLDAFSYLDASRKLMREFLGLNDEIAIVHVGRFTYQKNHKFLINVFKEIKNLNYSSKFFLLGDGELKDSVRKQVDDMSLGDSVVFLGNRKNIGEYLQAMDAMIFPSVYEGFGTVVLESQCNGLPTLASSALPKEIKITDCLEVMSLKKKPYEWATTIMHMVETIKRKDRKSEVKNAGYDITDTYKMLSEFYLTCLNPMYDELEG